MATTLPPLTGTLPALVTPLSDKATIDVASLEAAIRRAVDDRASGVLLAGTTGEGSLLSPEQRVELTRAGRRVVDGLGRDDLVLLAGASGPTMRALHDDVGQLAAAGADAVLVLPPATQPLTPDEVADLHLDIAERAAVPTLAYHIPQLTGSPLTPETVQQLAVHPRIVGMKDSSPDADRRARFVEVTADRDDYAVFTGHAPTMTEALQAGVAGSITAIANVRQRHVIELRDAVAAGDTARASTLQEGLTRLTADIAAIDRSVPAVLKAALQLDGVIHERWCVPPLRSVDGAQLDQVRTAMLR